MRRRLRYWWTFWSEVVMHPCSTSVIDMETGKLLWRER